MMILRFAVYLMAATVFAGSLVLVALLTPALNNAMGLIGAAALGFMLAVPVTWVVAKNIQGGASR